MTPTSAGLLMYRKKQGRVQVLLVHPGGPFWKNKDAGAWSIPKGEYDPQREEPMAAARREFEEELGFPPFMENPVELGEIRLKSGKRIRAWAFEGDCDPAAVRCNTFSMQWPPKSTVIKEFYEVDRAEWFDLDRARDKINPGQAGFVDALENILARSGPQGQQKDA
ncbi:MAG: NUDIX domain-containing protein [Desulfosalsimonas sp.]